MQYCRNCGRQLPAGKRFCDRCGQSVRQSRNTEIFKKQQQIEKLQKDRLERKRRQDEREAIEKERQARRREMRRKQNKVLVWILASVAAVVAVAIVSFIVTTIGSKDDEWKTSAIGSLDATSVPTMQPSVTAEPSPEVTPESKVSYGTYILSNDMNFSYPKSFTEASGDEDAELSFEDSYGAEIDVYLVEYPGGTAAGLMQKFVSKQGGEKIDSDTGNDWYSVTVQNGDKILHRKCIIDMENDLIVYYDLKYSEIDTDIEDYEAYIEYMDSKFGSTKSSKAAKESD